MDSSSKPEGKKIIDYKWIFKKKDDVISMEKVKYKARLVARGFTQEDSVAYNEIFSPVVKHSSI